MADPTGVLSARVPLPFYERVEAFVKETDPEKGGRTRVIVAALEAYMAGGEGKRAPFPVPPGVTVKKHLLHLIEIQEGGITSADLAAFTGIPQNRVAARLSNLLNEGKISKSVPSAGLLPIWTLSK